jgi:hypothetical protein
MSFNQQHIVKTGDVILFSGNAFGGFIVRTFVSSIWNHVGIAARFIKIYDSDDNTKFIRKLSLTEQGDLYIYETNTYTRMDDIFGHETNGPGFTRADYIFNKYNKIAFRKLHDIFRTDHFSHLFMQFALSKKDIKFPESGLPFLAVWLGISLSDNNTIFNIFNNISNYFTSYHSSSTVIIDNNPVSTIIDNNPNSTIIDNNPVSTVNNPSSTAIITNDKINKQMFCSELTANCYLYCIGPQYEIIMQKPFDNKFTTIFGSNCPLTGDTFTPGHYSHILTPYSSIFENYEEDIYNSYSNLFFTILMPVILILIIVIIIYITLPK